MSLTFGTIMLASGIAGGGAALGGYLGKPDKMEQGYDIVQMPQYSWTEPNRRLLADYLSQNMERMGRGEAPAWWDKAKPQIREGMSRQNRETYFGRPGERTGIMQATSQMGAMGGVGPKAMMAQGGKALQDYASQEKSIDEYLTGLGVDIQREGEGRYMTGLMGMPGGPETQIVNKMGGVSGGNQWGQQVGDLMGSLGKSLPWENMFQKQPGGINSANFMGNAMNQFSSPSGGGLLGGMGPGGNYFNQPIQPMTTQLGQYKPLSSGLPSPF